MRTVAATVAGNVAEVRDLRRLSVRALADRLAEIGHPILASGISKIENAERKVSVEDLVALALALDVSPVRLLLPAEPGEDEIALTPGRSATWDRAWRWAVGEQPIEPTADPKPTSVRGRGPLRLADARIKAFITENRPFEEDQYVREVARAIDAREPSPWVIRAHNDGKRTSWSFGYGGNHEEDEDDEGNVEAYRWQ